MEKTIGRKVISILVIAVMVASIFTIPAFNDEVSAASKKAKVKVTFKANGGKFTAKKYKTKKTYTKKVVKKKKLGKLPKISRKGYTFKGWYTKKTGGKKVTAGTKIKKKTTVYARWQKIVPKNPSSYNLYFLNYVGYSSDFISFQDLFGTLKLDSSNISDENPNITEYNYSDTDGNIYYFEQEEGLPGLRLVTVHMELKKKVPIVINEHYTVFMKKAGIADYKLVNEEYLDEHGTSYQKEVLRFTYDNRLRCTIEIDPITKEVSPTSLFSIESGVFF